jgi:dihydrofolate reductase
MTDSEASEMQGGATEVVPMRKVVVSTYVTLDGVMEDPGGAEGFEHGGWSMRFFDEDAAKYARDQLFASDALLLGRVTYEGFAAAWPSVTDEVGFADRMNSMPKFVVSKTLEEVEWNNSRLIKENVAEEVSKLKQQTGQDILMYGSADLMHTLMQHDLIDEYRIWVHPVVLGSGKRLFKDGSDTTTLRLVDTKTTSTGVVVLSYQPAGKEGEG